MTLCDTGPLVALIDRQDSDHSRSAATLRQLDATDLVTTWACVTEAMYFLYHAGGFVAQDELWSMVAEGILRLHAPAAGEWERIRALMQRYADAPMDFADATLVAAGEALNLYRVFTLDRHFRAYRSGRRHFEVVP